MERPEGETRPASEGSPRGDEVQYLLAGWRDMRPMLNLVRVCFGRDAWPWPDVLAALVFPRTIRQKAVVGEKLVGFVIGDRRWGRDLGWIAAIGVHPEYRRSGIGRRLLENCEQILGSSRVRLTLRASNQPAMRLYEKMGYRRVDVWRRYYEDGEDGLVMEKRLDVGHSATI